MIKKPTVGIIMPAYNQGQYIDDALRSLRKQTFQDFEVNIVDDGSTDGVTPEKLKTIQYDKARLFLNSDNIGVARRQEEHYGILENKYIFIFCADDIIKETFIEECVTFLESHPEYGAVSTNTLYFQDKTKPYPGDTWDPERLTIPHLLAGNNFLGSAMMRKKAVDSMDRSGGFTRYQDWDRWVSMLEDGWKLGIIEKPLFLYRQHPQSLSHRAKIEDEIKVREQMLKKHQKSYKKYYREIILNLYKNYLNLWNHSRSINEELHAIKMEKNHQNHLKLVDKEYNIGVKGALKLLLTTSRSYIKKRFGPNRLR